MLGNKNSCRFQLVADWSGFGPREGEVNRGNMEAAA